MNRQSLYTQLSIAALAALLFIPFLGGAHLFDWDEINFAESAREMLISGNYLTVQIDFRPFLEKPPLFIWMHCRHSVLAGALPLRAQAFQPHFRIALGDGVCWLYPFAFLFSFGYHRSVVQSVYVFGHLLPDGILGG